MELEGSMEIMSYLETTALNELSKRFELSKQSGLDILSKSLLYENYDQLVRFSELYKDDFNHLLQSSENWAMDLLDLRNGFFFSEFILQRELGMELADAYSLKLIIDNYYPKDKFPLSSGNFNFSILSIVSKQAQLIRTGVQQRMMFGYPIDFYCRMYDHQFYTLSGAYLEMEALWCDGMSIPYPLYFSGKNNLRLYIEHILEALVSYNHLIICELVINRLRSHLPELLQFVIDSFETHFVYEKNGFGELKPYGLFLPSSNSNILSLIRSSSNSSTLSIKPKKWSLGEKLEFIMKASGITQKQLQDKSGIHERTIRNALKRKSGYPDFHTIKLLCSALSWSLNDFLQDIE